MDKALIRNFLIFVVILLSCSGLLAYGLISGNKDLDKTDDMVIQTQHIITEAEGLSRQVEGMLSSQRGYILTSQDSFLQVFEARKQKASEHIAQLSAFNRNNEYQLSRIDEIRSYFTEFSMRLEENAQIYLKQGSEQLLDDVEVVNNIKNNISRINNEILLDAYNNIDAYVRRLDAKRNKYFSTLLIGITVGTLVLLFLNGFLLTAQRKRNKAEISLKDTEARFELAVQGSQDGIFDWDIKKDAVFYSTRYFTMLGYDRSASIGTLDDFKDLIHPDDADEVWEHIQHYLNGELSEYTNEFRLRHQSGRWVHIQARGKALYDKKGKPYRMVGAHTDITHLVKTQERLESEKKQAELANIAKTEFLAHMSHEIRTPLTAISGIAEIFTNNQNNLDDKQKQLANTLFSSTTNLKDLINDLLDFSKIESGEMDLDERAFEIDRLFEEIISMMSLRATEKKVGFVFDYSDFKGASFYGDEMRIRQVLLNLIGNAIKFTEKGSITISPFQEERDGEQFLRIDIQDTGTGIAEDKFEVVFERFKQADASVSRKYGGTGLGLPISKNLAALMGGDIIFTSEIDVGSTFSLILPMRLSQSNNRNDNKTTPQSKKITDKIRASINNSTKVLLVEDYEGNIVVISYILNEIGLDYDIARNGAEAVKLWSENHYDLVLMDIQMPVMDGFTATKKIRDTENENNLQHTPVIGMTAHALVGDKDKCIAAGMDAYLPKPIVDADLKQTILNFIDKKQKSA